MRPCDVEYVQRRTLLIGGKQVRFHCAVLAQLLCQQLIIVLHDRTLYRTLYFCGQTIFQVKAPDWGLRRGSRINQLVPSVVVIAGEERFAIRQHGRVPE
ncbi:hypothetical protein D3C87_1213970 [compost metagenome]